MFKKLNGIIEKMNISASFIFLTIIAFLHFTSTTQAQSKVLDVKTFNKVIISPHIDVIFKAGETESVSIESMTVPMEKLNMDQNNKTLHLYLEGAKITSPNKKEYINGYERKTSVYDGAVAKVIITYIDVSSFDLRGEERFVFENKLEAEKIRLKIYGESQVFMNEVNIEYLHASIYGENHLVINDGFVAKQKITVYGESEINTMNIDNTETKLIAYGEGDFKLNVSDEIKITSFGESTIQYAGSPNIDKGIIIGETEITNVGY